VHDMCTEALHCSFNGGHLQYLEAGKEPKLCRNAPSELVIVQQSVEREQRVRKRTFMKFDHALGPLAPPFQNIKG
jgi:hypothetical protein